MRYPVEIEEIEAKRLEVGIDDVELRAEIRTLRVGDFVNLTFLIGTDSSETLSVRITSIRGHTFRGKLADGPTAKGLSSLHVGSPVVFKAGHIHSLAKKQPTHGR